MKRIIIAFSLFLAGTIPAFAQTENDGTTVQAVDEIVGPVTGFLNDIVFHPIALTEEVSIPIIVIWLLGAAMFLTVYFRFLNFRAFRHAIDIVRGIYDDPNDTGEVSHFQALTTALSGTVGIGNISGVAIAVSMGGPGATFWMIVAGLMGMSSKFAECTLGVKYRVTHADGSVSGGPMYYLQQGFARRGMGRLGILLAGFFALTCVGGAFGGANMFQINQASQQLISVTGGAESPLFGHGWVIGLAMAVVVAFVIIGGIKSIAKVTDKIVPLMVGVYLLGALGVILAHWQQIPTALLSIVTEAFGTEAVSGGLIGVLVIGFQRAQFSNEAGLGSASIAHAAAKTNEPVSEGVVALLEPFIDTVVVCTVTALVIIISGEYQSGGEMEGIALTSRAFESVFGWFPFLLSAAVILFALSTLLSWSYYGMKAWAFVFGDSNISNLTYKILFCGVIVLGASISQTNVVDLSNILIFSMGIPNVIGLYLMAPELKRDVALYFAKLKAGKIPRFDKPAENTSGVIPN
ncbi:alanine glycine permease [Fulvitalea axinellae]|uniref:Alanine glycine permease n=1 Tax=Fulvitalea axinellae TaxID=1182444 RepID=A0AAU9CKC8_9BACT|nr:alanine glycine permease [Fulvitalea axinellae]